MISGLLLSCVLFPLVFGIAGTGFRQPNIVLFLADDLGIGDVGIFGNRTMRTPNIDRLGQEGVKLERHYAASSVCTPSRAALLTGRYPIRTGLAQSFFRVLHTLAIDVGLPPSEVTFAEQAKVAGYTTGLVGKWHLGVFNIWRNSVYHPLRQGFDSFYGIPMSNVHDFDESNGRTYIRLEYVLPQMILLYVCFTLPYLYLFNGKGAVYKLTLFLLTAVYVYFNAQLIIRNSKDSILMNGYDVIEQPVRWRGLTKRFVNKSIEFLEERKATDEPFLLFVSWHYPHPHLAPMQEFEGTSRHGPYGDCVEELDWGTGQILDALERLGQADDTLVYFTSDHGGHVEENAISSGGYNGRYKGGKGWGGVEGGILTPGLIRWPGRVPRNTVIHEPTSLMDIFPTLSDIMGVANPTDRPIDGKSILNLVTQADGKAVSPHEFLFHYCGSELHAATYIPKGETHEKERPIWKIAFRFPNITSKEECAHYPPYINNICSCGISIARDPPLLFELTSDPEEAKPITVTQDSKQFDIIKRVKIELKKHEATLISSPAPYTLLDALWKPHLQLCCNFPNCMCNE